MKDIGYYGVIQLKLQLQLREKYANDNAMRGRVILVSFITYRGLAYGYIVSESGEIISDKAIIGLRRDEYPGVIWSDIWKIRV